MIPAPFKLVPILVPLLVVVFALAMAAFPRKMTRWQRRGPDGTTQIEPNGMRLLMMRFIGIVLGALALLVAFGAYTILP